MEKIIQLTKIEIKLNYSKNLVAMGISYGIGFLGFLVALFSKYILSMGVNIYNFNSILDFSYRISLFIGIIFAANTFTEIIEKKWAVFYYTLPANSEIKVISKIIYTLLFYFLLNVLFLMTTTIIIIILAKIFNVQYYMYSFKSLINLIVDSFFVYLFFHSLYFLFSVLWNKNSFFATTGVLLGLAFLLSIFAGLLTFIILNYLVKDLNLQYVWKYYFNKKWVTNLLKFLYYTLPLLFYFLTYYEFRQKEIKGQ